MTSLTKAEGLSGPIRLALVLDADKVEVVRAPGRSGAAWRLSADQVGSLVVLRAQISAAGCSGTGSRLLT